MESKKWDCRKYGSESDRIRQSDLNDIASGFGCSLRFKYRKEHEALDSERPLPPIAYGATCLGSAVHETIRLYLQPPHGDRIVAGKGVDLPAIENIMNVLNGRFERERRDRPVEWRDGKNPSEEITAACHMVRGALESIGRRAEKILVVESPFHSSIEQGGRRFHLEGTIDVAFRSREGRVVLADWKSGEAVVPQPVLDHGYQTGIYAQALLDGTFFPDEPGKTFQVGLFPDEIYVVQLRDYVPYSRATKKQVRRAEQAEFYGVGIGATVSPKKGDVRGPAWYRASRTESDQARLRLSLSKIVSGIRLGVMYESIDDHCNKCTFRGPCLNDGHVDAALRDQVGTLLRSMPEDMSDGF